MPDAVSPGRVLWLAAAALAGCGGGNPLGNPPDVENPPGASGQKLAFAYFQRCINPIFDLALPIDQNGVISTNTCAASGCHDNTSGTGGAFRVRPLLDPIRVQDPANTPEVIRAGEMYKNFYSAQGSTVPAAAGDSRLLNKPLVRGVLHGGGLIFASDQDPLAKLMRYWIEHPAPLGQDEFSSATWQMFEQGDPDNGACKTE